MGRKQAETELSAPTNVEAIADAALGALSGAQRAALFATGDDEEKFLRRAREIIGGKLLGAATQIVGILPLSDVQRRQVGETLTRAIANALETC